MVFSGEDKGHEKTRHNFTLPSWGIQRSLRCVKEQSNDVHQRLPHPSELEKEGIEEYVEKMKVSIFRERVVDYEEKRGVSPPVEVKPWNLRKRRAACKSPPITESRNCHDAKFMSTLSKKEVEDDYMAMMGHRPPRRPKKRLRTIQKQIDLLHPAFYFTEVTEDLYQVPDVADNRKR